jgi:hypothetical protein
MQKYPLPLLLCTLPSLAAAAPACNVLSEREAFARAESVFIARIIKVEEQAMSVPLGEPAVYIHKGRFFLIEAIKGAPPTSGAVSGNPEAECDLPLSVGRNYLFFVEKNQGAPRAARLWHSRPFDSPDGAEEKATRERLRTFQAQ